MRCWLARSHSKTHIRIQLEPFDFAWPGWDIRESEVSDDEYRRLCESTDAVEIERLHQECWLRGGELISTGLAAASGPRPDLR